MTIINNWLYLPIFFIVLGCILTQSSSTEKNEVVYGVHDVVIPFGSPITIARPVRARQPLHPENTHAVNGRIVSKDYTGKLIKCRCGITGLPVEGNEQSHDNYLRYNFKCKENNICSSTSCTTVGYFSSTNASLEWLVMHFCRLRWTYITTANSTAIGEREAFELDMFYGEDIGQQYDTYFEYGCVTPMCSWPERNKWWTEIEWPKNETKQIESRAEGCLKNSKASVVAFTLAITNIVIIIGFAV